MNVIKIMYVSVELCCISMGLISTGTQCMFKVVSEFAQRRYSTAGLILHPLILRDFSLPQHLKCMHRIQNAHAIYYIMWKFYLSVCASYCGSGHSMTSVASSAWSGSYPRLRKCSTGRLGFFKPGHG